MTTEHIYTITTSNRYQNHSDTSEDEDNNNSESDNHNKTNNSIENTQDKTNEAIEDLHNIESELIDDSNTDPGNNTGWDTQQGDNTGMTKVNKTKKNTTMEIYFDNIDIK